MNPKCTKTQFAHEELGHCGVPLFFFGKKRTIDSIQRGQNGRPTTWTLRTMVAIFGRWWRPSWQPGSKFHQQDYLINLWCCVGPDDCDHLHFWTPIIFHRCSTDRSASACWHRPGYPSTVFSMDKSWRWTGSRIGPFDKRFRTN